MLLARIHLSTGVCFQTVPWLHAALYEQGAADGCEDGDDDLDDLLDGFFLHVIKVKG